MTDTFTGWAGTAKDKPLEKMELPLRKWDENCVDIKISHCGICGSDVHVLDSGWGPTDYPCVVGHEITGTATRVGDNVKNIKVGDRVGVGPQCDCCYECEACEEGHGNVCENGIVTTYASKWKTGDKTYGGYADKWRGDYRWVFKIPEGMTNEEAACFLCAGVTTFAPLKNGGVTEKSTVGVLGIGGLGHFGILIAKAMGAKVIGMSHNDKKKEVAKELGCDDYINTGNEADMAKYRKRITHILCTGTGRDFKWGPYFQLLHANGKFLNVSAPEWNFPEVSPFELLINQVSICGSAAGSQNDTEEMLEFAASHSIKPWITKYKMDDVNKAIEDFRAGKPRFRFVLEN